MGSLAVISAWSLLITCSSQPSGCCQWVTSSDNVVVISGWWYSTASLGACVISEQNVQWSYKDRVIHNATYHWYYILKWLRYLWRGLCMWLINMMYCIRAKHASISLCLIAFSLVGSAQLWKVLHRKTQNQQFPFVSNWIQSQKTVSRDEKRRVVEN